MSPVHSFVLQVWRGNGTGEIFHYKTKNNSGEEIFKIKSTVEHREGSINFGPAVIRENKFKLDYFKKDSAIIYFETKDSSKEYEGYIEIVVENDFFSKIFIGEIVNGVFFQIEEKVEIKDRNHRG